MTRFIAIPTETTEKVRGAIKNATIVTGASRAECRRILEMVDEDFRAFTIIPFNDSAYAIANRKKGAKNGQ